MNFSRTTRNLLQSHRKRLHSYKFFSDNGFIQRSDDFGISFPVSNFAEHMMIRSATAYQDAISTECLLTGQNSSYAEIHDEALKYAAAFAGQGFERGDVVLVSLANGTLFPKVAFALAYIGVTAALLNPMFTSYETSRIITNTKAKALITQDIFLPNIAKAVKSLPGGSNFRVYVENLSGQRSATFRRLSSILTGLPSTSDLVSRSVFNYRNTTAFMQFSGGGTTGPQKGIQLSHYNMTSASEAQSHGLNPDCVKEGGVLSVVPTFHVYGLVHVTSVLMSMGVKVMTLPIFDYDLFLHSLKMSRPSGLSLLPPLAIRMSQDPNCTKDHMSSLCWIGCGGAALPIPVIEALRAKSSREIAFMTGYGMSECPAIASSLNGPPGTIGKLVANTEAKYVDIETGKTVRLGGVGEICVKGPQVMQGYFGNSTATASMFNNGWLLTGVIGYCRDDGNIVFVDRKKDIVQYEGFQVSPTELEDIILQVPGVEAACVVGVPDDDSSAQIYKAYVVAKEGVKVTEGQVHDMVSARLSPYKRLRGGIEFVPALPISPREKFLGTILRGNVSADF